MNNHPSNPDYQTARIALANAQTLLRQAITAHKTAESHYAQARDFLITTAAWALPVLDAKENEPEKCEVYGR